MIIKFFPITTSMLKVMLFLETLENHKNIKYCLSLNLQAVYSERSRIIGV